MRALILFTIATLLTSTDVSAQRRRAVRTPSAPPVTTVRLLDDFRFGTHGWTADFCDYSTAMDPAIMELDSGLRPLPPELGVPGTGFMITGHNRSDDLFMFFTKKLTRFDGVKPNQQYLATFRIVFASNAAEKCPGIGGSPGDSVVLKAGAIGEEPRVIVVQQGLAADYLLNVDKGNQSVDGAAVTTVSTIANGTPNCHGGAPYVSLDRTRLHKSVVTANADGELWLLAGTESGFEGKTTLYYQSIEVVLEPVRPGL